MTGARELTDALSVAVEAVALSPVAGTERLRPLAGGDALTHRAAGCLRRYELGCGLDDPPAFDPSGVSLARLRAELRILYPYTGRPGDAESLALDDALALRRALFPRGNGEFTDALVHPEAVEGLRVLSQSGRWLDGPDGGTAGRRYLSTVRLELLWRP